MTQQSRLESNLYQAVRLRVFVLLQVFHLGLLLVSLKLSLVFLFWDVLLPLLDRPISGSKGEFQKTPMKFKITDFYSERINPNEPFLHHNL